MMKTLTCFSNCPRFGFYSVCTWYFINQVDKGILIAVLNELCSHILSICPSSELKGPTLNHQLLVTSHGNLSICCPYQVQFISNVCLCRLMLGFEGSRISSAFLLGFFLNASPVTCHKVLSFESVYKCTLYMLIILHVHH